MLTTAIYRTERDSDGKEVLDKNGKPVKEWYPVQIPAPKDDESASQYLQRLVNSKFLSESDARKLVIGQLVIKLSGEVSDNSVSDKRALEFDIEHANEIPENIRGDKDATLRWAKEQLEQGGAMVDAERAESLRKAFRTAIRGWYNGA